MKCIFDAPAVTAAKHDIVCHELNRPFQANEENRWLEWTTGDHEWDTEAEVFAFHKIYME
jgi:hypothetical protein